MISRRSLVLAAAAGLAGCGTRRDKPAPLTETVGTWRRTAMRDLPPGEGAEPPARGTVRRLMEAEYSGPGRVQVRLYELSSSAVAFEAAQRSRAAPDTVSFNQGNLFAVVAWQGAPDRKLLGEFVRALEKSLAAAK